MSLFKLGLEVLLDERTDLLHGKTIGLVTNHTGVSARLESGIDLMAAHPAPKLAALFAPEHGVWGDKQAGEAVGTSVDTRTGLTVHSLYGASKRPTGEMLKGIDVLVCHLQDVGCRYWTYLSTVACVLEAAAEHRVPVVMLDRPNPIGGRKLEGNLLEPDYRSFVGCYPLPIRHGLTLGEAARLINDTAIHAALEVVPMKGWGRDDGFEATGLLWVPASPNTPKLDTLLVYPGTCLFEGSNLSEGRGTTLPFECVGAPWLDGERWAERLNALELPGVMFRPTSFIPSFSKHQGSLCSGVQVHVTDRQGYEAVTVGLHMLATARALEPQRFAWLPPHQPKQDSRRPIDLLAGTEKLAQAIDAGQPVPDTLASWAQERQAFETLRQPYLMY